jgi:hypothetical protein
VLPQGADAIVGQELGSDYYDAAAPVVEIQVARAGYRLAAWLDLIASAAKDTQIIRGDEDPYPEEDQEPEQQEVIGDL